MGVFASLLSGFAERTHLGICHLAWWRNGREVVLNVAYVSCITLGIEWEERSLDWSCATRGLWTHLEFTLSQRFSSHFQQLTPHQYPHPLGLIQGSIPSSQMPAGYFPWVTCQSLRSILNSKLSIVQRSSLTCIFYTFPLDITQAFDKLTGSNLKVGTSLVL